MCGGLVHLWILEAAVGLFGVVATETAMADEYEAAVARAVARLPHPPEKVVVMVRETGTPLIRERLKHTEGFVTRGERVVYLIKESDTLERARKGPGVFDYILALIIWHEMAHIDGADEREAMRREEDLWMQYVSQQRINTDQGLRYLAVLRKRH